MRGQLRRQDRGGTPDEAWSLLDRAFRCAIGTVDPDGWPYVVPRLFVTYEGKLYFHATVAKGHTRRNIEADPRVCIEVDEPGPVFPSGDRSLCETSAGFESVVLFGTCRIIDDQALKTTVLERLMAKYADPAWERPAVWNHMAATAVYEVAVERITFKRRPVTPAAKWQHLFPTEV